MENSIKNKISEWSRFAKEDIDLVKEYDQIKNDEEKLNDAFYKELAFGTGGLRGVLGFGTNRMNIYVIRKATLGVANYLKNEYKGKKLSVAISFDSRIKSDVFAKEAAKVLASNDIHAYLYDKLMPVPLLSFATRELNCDAGIMITASHNPSKYNGFKVYGNDGCQITEIAAEKVLNEINKINCFEIKTKSFEDLVNEKKIEMIGNKILNHYVNRVIKESVLGPITVDKNVKIVYSPLNGSGLVPVTKVLKEAGFNNIIVVEEQKKPDGHFPTCPYPNPEVREAMELGLKYAKENDADLLIATDPDADRCGIAVKDKDDYRLLTGNDVGVLLLNFICELRTINNTMPKKPFAVKTIVSTEMADAVANYFGIELYSVLTGFKYIGEVIKRHEEKGEEKNFIFGFEESYGYLSGTHVRDKDAVNAALLICEMFTYYRSLGISLIEKQEKLYQQFGYFANKLENFVFEGSSGFIKMNSIMEDFRKGINEIGGYKVKNMVDYQLGIDGLPKSNVIKFVLENKSTVIVRPSGTEPKLKMYSSIVASSKNEINVIYNYIYQDLSKRFK